MTTMADLTPGTRIYHPRWDTCFVDVQVSDEGLVYPGDVEIIEEMP